jgi:GNAT superfamily N-acetyltransferase
VSIVVRHAVLTDSEESVSILQESANWLIAKGMPLWVPSNFTFEWMKTNVASGRLVVAEREGQVVAVVLRLWEDMAVWPDRAAGEAVYLHKLAVRRSFAGQGIIADLVNWVADEAFTQGRKYLRLDCVQRPPLLAIYNRLGFVAIDERRIGEFTVVRHEREIERDCLTETAAL